MDWSRVTKAIKKSCRFEESTAPSFGEEVEDTTCHHALAGTVLARRAIGVGNELFIFNKNN
jgi:hypothetical protein